MKYNPNFKIKEKKDQIKELYLTLKWIFSFYFEHYPYRTSIFITLNIISSLRPIVYAYFIGKVIDALINLSSTASSISDFYPYLGFLFGFTVIFEVFVNIGLTFLRRNLARESSVKLDQVFYEKIYFLGVQKLEDPDFLNVSKRAGEWLRDCFYVLEECIRFLSNVTSLIISLFIVYSFLPLAIPAFVLFAVIRFFPIRYFDKKDFEWQVNEENSDGMRRARNSMSWLHSPNGLQEIFITGAYDFFDKKYVNFYDYYLKGLRKIVKQRSLTNASFEVLNTLLTLGAYTVVFSQAIAGLITVGSVAFYMRSIDTFINSISSTLSSFAWISEFSLKMRDLMAFFDMKPNILNGSVRLDVTNGAPSVEFKNVYFKYPKSDKWVFENLNLKIDSTEKVAIVGHNGAGKTTLIKLICRFYDVNEGQILLNGIDIKNLELESLYKNLGVVFQEYNFYKHLTLKENILLGDISKKYQEEELKKVSERADILSFVNDYKNGFDQVMGEQFKDGTRLSTGQQQKIAIARFFYRNAPLAIFDEPTSAIDAVAEYKIFNEIYKYFKKKTVIIVSHRFSTVRNADRIIVLNNGKLAEQGTHEELLVKGRIYAHAFKLQAEGYR